MPKGALSLVPLLSIALLAGCDRDPEGTYTESDGVVPAGAIPAAPDVRPGTQSAPGNVQQAGMPPGQAGQPAVQTSGATSPGAIDTAAAAAAPADTAR